MALKRYVVTLSSKDKGTKLLNTAFDAARHAETPDAHVFYDEIGNVIAKYYKRSVEGIRIAADPNE